MFFFTPSLFCHISAEGAERTAHIFRGLITDLTADAQRRIYKRQVVVIRQAVKSRQAAGLLRLMMIRFAGINSSVQHVCISHFCLCSLNVEAVKCICDIRLPAVPVFYRGIAIMSCNDLFSFHIKFPPFLFSPVFVTYTDDLMESVNDKKHWHNFYLFCDKTYFCSKHEHMEHILERSE